MRGSAERKRYNLAMEKLQHERDQWKEQRLERIDTLIFKRPTHRGGIKGTRRKQNNISGTALQQTPGMDTTISDISTNTG